MLQRQMLAELPRELKEKYPKGTIIRVIKPLYGIAEAGVHWFFTYNEHHRHKLSMETSTFDPCLLITTTGTKIFGIVGMQTDDTLAIGTDDFADLESTELEKAAFRAKPQSFLIPGTAADFNGVKIIIHKSGKLELMQKGQGTKIEIISPSAADGPQRYLEQRARGAYLASICQPEASFDLSIAAQVQKPRSEDFKAINKRLQWQMNNISRGLTYIPLDLATAKLVIFADSSFANNNDLSSQLGFVITLVNEEEHDGFFKISGNLIHWSSTKCKRVTRSVLASEIYGMVSGFDSAYAVSTTIQKIMHQLSLPPIPLVICTDSLSLYECLVKLGTTKEKRLMIDIMALRESYEKREITEVRWIHGEDNPADAMTKTSCKKSLEQFINDNKLVIRVQGFVNRPLAKEN